MQNTIISLYSHLEKYPWFAGKIEPNPILHNSIVVYVSEMSPEVIATIPDQLNGFQIRVWTEVYSKCSVEKYTDLVLINSNRTVSEAYILNSFGGK